MSTAVASLAGLTVEQAVPADPSKDLCVAQGRDVLGECPLWDDRAQVLWWVDIRAPALCQLDTTRQLTRRWPLPDLVGSIALTDGHAGHGRDPLLVALGHRLALFDADTGLQTLSEVPLDHEDHRFNDGRCDPKGRFWVGTMNNLSRGAEGRMFRFDLQEGLVEFPALAQGLRIPNSLAFSPDGRTMYFADSLDHAVRAYDYDPRTGMPGTSRTFASCTPPAFPDGACVDSEGGLWSARFHGGSIVRHHSDGSLDRVIELPVRRPTSCAFGGAGLDTLYVTTTCQHMSPAEQAAEPLAGRLLALNVGHRGLREPRFRLRD